MFEFADNNLIVFFNVCRNEWNVLIILNKNPTNRNIPNLINLQGNSCREFMRGT